MEIEQLKAFKGFTLGNAFLSMPIHFYVDQNLLTKKYFELICTLTPPQEGGSITPVLGLTSTEFLINGQDKTPMVSTILGNTKAAWIKGKNANVFVIQANKATNVNEDTLLENIKVYQYALKKVNIKTNGKLRKPFSVYNIIGVYKLNKLTVKNVSTTSSSTKEAPNWVISPGLFKNTLREGYYYE